MTQDTHREKGKNWETFKVESQKGLQRLKELIEKGNLRRVVIEHNGRTVAEFPLMVGVIGVVAAPVLAAVGSLVALLKECTIHVETTESPAQGHSPAGTRPAAASPVDAEC